MSRKKSSSSSSPPATPSPSASGGLHAAMRAKTSRSSCRRKAVVPMEGWPRVVKERSGCCAPVSSNPRDRSPPKSTPPSLAMAACTRSSVTISLAIALTSLSSVDCADGASAAIPLSPRILLRAPPEATAATPTGSFPSEALLRGRFEPVTWHLEQRVKRHLEQPSPSRPDAFGFGTVESCRPTRVRSLPRSLPAPT